MRIPAFEKGAKALEAFLAALSGRGAGSGWNHKQQIQAILNQVPLREGMVILDVGGNNGKWSQSIYKQVSDHMPEFHIFECAPYCFDHLEKNTRNMKNVSIVKKAVSKDSGYATLNVPILPSGTGSGLASLHRREESSIAQHSYEEICVEKVSLDEYIKQAGIEHVDLLKVDVEGHEPAVFEGALSTLRSKTSVVTFEFGSGNVNSRTFFATFGNYLMISILSCIEFCRVECRVEYC
jgi:FkbM family methyltransferase